MILREHNGWQLWAEAHPSSIGCVAEGRERCDHKYHLIDASRTNIQSFDDWGEADSAFCQESGAEKLNPIKTA